jgi:hypothetical protein
VSNGFNALSGACGGCDASPPPRSTDELITAEVITTLVSKCLHHIETKDVGTILLPVLTTMVAGISGKGMLVNKRSSQLVTLAWSDFCQVYYATTRSDHVHELRFEQACKNYKVKMEILTDETNKHELEMSQLIPISNIQTRIDSRTKEKMKLSRFVAKMRSNEYEIAQALVYFLNVLLLWTRRRTSEFTSPFGPLKYFNMVLTWMKGIDFVKRPTCILDIELTCADDAIPKRHGQSKGGTAQEEDSMDFTDEDQAQVDKDVTARVWYAQLQRGFESIVHNTNPFQAPLLKKTGNGVMNRLKQRRASVTNITAVVDALPLLKEVHHLQGITPGMRLEGDAKPAMGGRRVNSSDRIAKKRESKPEPYTLVPSLAELESLEQELRLLTERMERQYGASYTLEKGTSAMDGRVMDDVLMSLPKPLIVRTAEGRRGNKFPPYIPSSLRSIFRFYKYRSEESVKLLSAHSLNRTISFIFNRMLLSVFEIGPFCHGIQAIQSIARFCFDCLFGDNAVPAVGESTVFSVMKTVYQMDTLNPQAHLFARLCEFDGYPKLPVGSTAFFVESRRLLLEHSESFHFDVDQHGVEWVKYTVAEAVAQIFFTAEEEASRIMKLCRDGAGDNINNPESVETSVLLEHFLDAWVKDTEHTSHYTREAIQAFVADLDGETPSFDDLDFLFEILGLDLTSIETSIMYRQAVEEPGLLDAELLQQLIIENGCYGHPQECIVSPRLLTTFQLAEISTSQEQNSLVLLVASWHLIQDDVDHLMGVLGSEGPIPQYNRFQDTLSILKNSAKDASACPSSTTAWTAFNRLLLPLEDRGICEGDSAQTDSLVIKKSQTNRRQAVDQQELYRLIALGAE